MFSDFGNIQSLNILIAHRRINLGLIKFLSLNDSKFAAEMLISGYIT